MDTEGGGGDHHRQMDEIRAALVQPRSTRDLPDRSWAYASLLEFQRLHASSPSDAVSDLSSALIPLILGDVALPNEEVAAQALKCLGFMIYHPSIVPHIPGETVHMALESLVNLITTTTMKTVCNLSIWCISVQQLDVQIVSSHLNSLIRAVIYALDNPFASVAITYEAMQVIEKFTVLLPGEMTRMAYIWAPPIYRRLVSMDKKERETSERCLIKVESLVLPPTLALSETMAMDLKKQLLKVLVDMLHDNGKMFNALQAWKWYVRLLGDGAFKRRRLVNEMLKIPEKAFSSRDSHVQIASMATWTSLIDVLCPQQVPELGMTKAEINSAQQAKSRFIFDDYIAFEDGNLKRLRLLMKPIIAILSKEKAASVLLSCLNCWCYLLYKLVLLVNQPSVRGAVLQPVFEAVFSKGPDLHNNLVWESCLDIFDEFASSKYKGDNNMNDDMNTSYQSFKITCSKSPSNGQGTWKTYPIKWLPWELNDTRTLLQLIGKIIHHGKASRIVDDKILVLNAALKIFKSVIRGVRIDVMKETTQHKSIQSCISAVLEFTKELCEDVVSSLIDDSSDLVSVCLQFIKTIKDEIEPSHLTSSLCVGLDLNYIKKLECEKRVEFPKIPFSALTHMSTVSPMFYLNILHFCVVFQATSIFMKSDKDSLATHNLNFLFSSSYTRLDLQSIISLFYMHGHNLVHHGIFLLKVWKVVAKNMTEQFDAMNDTLVLEEFDGAYGTLMHIFLCYPISLCFPPADVLDPKGCSTDRLSIGEDLECDALFETWKSLLVSIIDALQYDITLTVKFVEGFCKHLLDVLDENATLFWCVMESHLMDKLINKLILSFYVEAACCMLNQIQVLLEIEINDRDDDISRKTLIISAILKFASRVLMMLLRVLKAKLQADNVITTRFFAGITQVLSFLHSKKYFTLFIKEISETLIQWLSSTRNEVQSESILCALQMLWAQILESLQGVDPQIKFDSLLMELALFLRVTLDHPHSAISDVTVSFWNATFGRECNLQYPQCLLPLLRKLYRKGVIAVMKAAPHFLEDNISAFEPEEATQLKCADVRNKKQSLKRLDRADDGRNGHGGYVAGTSLDMSKRLKLVEKTTFVESDDKSVRRPEYILRMLKR